jgi:deoxyadenosine/deoxycytidine kinase
MLIAVEGITGIGKSTLQSILAKHYRAEIHFQEFEKHPYLATSDVELIKYALERELIFLFMAYHQLKNLDVTSKLVILDFIFDRLKVFATTSLSTVELENVYYPCFNYLRVNLIQPDLIIRLIGSSSFALSNIRNRNRTGEAYITEDHLVKLDQAFDALFKEYRDCWKVVVVNAEEYNLVNDQNAVQKLMQLVECQLPELRVYRTN